MTPGQERALRELTRLAATEADLLSIVETPRVDGGWLIVPISLKIGAREIATGGLDLRERESFVLFVPPEFPFDHPRLGVTDERFKGFDHVTWGKTLCLYQSKTEWSPADGLFGFFDRLYRWLDHAARNDMDPAGGPLEPPHHVTNYSHLPVVVRADAPAAPGQYWIGWAELLSRDNRVEIVGWKRFDEALTGERHAAVAVFLPQKLPMEFPERGREFFAELAKQAVDKGMMLSLLSLAAIETPEGEPLRLVLGLPMRRAADGSARFHIAVWATPPAFAGYMRSAIPQATDDARLGAMRTEFVDAVWEHFESTTLSWCRIFEDRAEIVVRRDAHTPMGWFRKRRVLLLGCGALGGWVAESVVRAQPAALHVVDNAEVRPGLLARQNFVLADIGSNKALALAKRLQAIDASCEIVGFDADAHGFVCADRERLSAYDLVIDCTASSIVQMKLERDWLSVRAGCPRFASFMIDANAQRCIGVALAPASVEGPWSAYLRLKNQLCTDGLHAGMIAAFYDNPTGTTLFQPEPGCSDPTFAGSTADVTVLAAGALNWIAAQATRARVTIAFALSAPTLATGRGLSHFALPAVRTVDVRPYRVVLARKVLTQAASFVRQGNRLRSPVHETGGLLWGYWDDAANVIVVCDASGPPPDSRHEPAHFQCGTVGTAAEHAFRAQQSRGVCGFVGFWHTHPGLPSRQSEEDILGMTGLVTVVGSNNRRALMLIFGRTAGQPTAGVYVYESAAIAQGTEFIGIGEAQVVLEDSIV